MALSCLDDSDNRLQSFDLSDADWRELEVKKTGVCTTCEWTAAWQRLFSNGLRGERNSLPIELPVPALQPTKAKSIVI
ncbi:hypothetical protein ACFSTD_00235 [Novosphingobium colocasiae]